MKVLNEKAIVVGLEYFNPDDYPKLEVVGCNMTSTEHLPWKQIKERNIKVISLKEYPEFLKEITSTAEHTIGLIITLFRQYKRAFMGPPFYDREMLRGHTLKGKTLGIIGYGRIGKMVDTIAKALGMEVITYDRYEGLTHTFYVGDLDGLLANSDIITLHIPLQDNEGFFTKEMFTKLKSTACIINTSRGKIIETGALVWALENKIISGAAVDFLEEDLVEYARTHSNLILTNHLGGNTFEDRERTENFIINIIKNENI